MSLLLFCYKYRMRLTVILTLVVALAGCPGDNDKDAGGDGMCKATVTCSGDACIGQPWTGGVFGDPCKDGPECQSGMCGQDSETGKSFCTQACDPSAQPCLYGAFCIKTEGGASTHVCGPPIWCQ